MPRRGQNGLVRVAVTRVERDGTMLRRMVDTARCSDRLDWERLAGRALEFPPPYHPALGIPVYHVLIGGRVILVAEPDLGGPMLNLIIAVLLRGDETVWR